VGEECTKDQVDISFGGSSVELRLRGYRGQNYIFGIKKLCGDINAVESKYLLKKNGITIVLVKKDTKSWAQLPFKEEKVRYGGFSLKARRRRRRRRILGPILWV
jgi:hypothetical protein